MSTQLLLISAVVVPVATVSGLISATPAYAADANCPVSSSPMLNPSSIYEVDDSRHLMWIRDDSTRWDDSYVMTANIDMGTCIWDSPIAPSWTNPYTPFSGVFDGDGHTLANLTVAVNTMSIDDSRAELAGFIGFMDEGGVIRDVTFDRALVTLDDTTNYDDSSYNRAYINVGVAVAYAESTGAGSTLHNITVVNSTIRSSVADVRLRPRPFLDSRRSHVGAVAGQVWSDDVSGLTTNSNIVVNTNNQSTGDGPESPTGGVIGASVGVMSALRSTDDSITVSGYDATAGGVIGDLWSGSIADVVVTRPSVLAVSPQEALAGGAIGWRSGNGAQDIRVIDGDVAASPVYPKVRPGWFQAGGAIAESDRGGYAAGIDVSTTSVLAQGWGFVNAGGVIGYSYDDTASHLTSDSTVQARSSGDDFSTVSAGGLIGLKDLRFGSDPLVISSYASGDATAYSDDTGAQVWVGGLVGYLYGRVENSYSTGDASATSLGPAGSAEAAGLVGASNGAIVQSYSTGAATVSTTSGDDTTGGLIATLYSPGVVTQSYWNSTTSGETVSDGGTALTTTQMNDPASFSGWAVVDGWQAQTNAGSPALPTSPYWGQCDVNSGFPFLLWEYNASPCAVPPSPPPPPAPVYAPSVPTSLSTVAGDESVVVSWVEPGSSGSFPIAAYQVQASPGSQVCLLRVTAGQSLTCEVTGLRNGTGYTFTVRALNGAGWGAWSASSDPVIPQAAPVILIVGSRGDVEGRPGVIVRGTSMGLGTGGIVLPWVKLAGQASYTETADPVLVDANGAFSWQRRTGKKVYVYVRTPDGTIRSNRVIIPAA